MVDVVLFVIPESEAESREVFRQDGSGKPPFPYFEGKGDTRLLCGECSFALAVGVGAGNAQLENLVMKCPLCGAYNETRI